MHERSLQLKELAADVLGDLAPGVTIVGLLEKFGIRVLDLLGIDVAVCVLDTSILLPDIAYAVRTRTLTGLMLAARTGLLRPFASASVFEEVPRKINERAQSLGVDPAAAAHLWRMEYSPWMHFLDPTGLPLLSGKVEELHKRDVTDISTGQIVELVKPDILLACDDDLTPFGPTGREIHVTVALAYRDQAVAESFLVGFNCGGSLALAAGSLALQALVDRIAKLDKRILLVCTIAGGIVLASPHVRRWVLERARDLGAAVGRVGGPARDCLGFLAELLTEVYSTRIEAGRIIECNKRRLDPPRTVYELAGMTLARAAGPLSATQMLECAADLGYRLRLHGGKRSVSTVLNQYPQLFRQRGQWRWGFRSP